MPFKAARGKNKTPATWGMDAGTGYYVFIKLFMAAQVLRSRNVSGIYVPRPEGPVAYL